MYPSSVLGQRSNRYKVENELGSFWAGTQFRAFKEITLAAAGTYVLKMTRPVDIVIRGFAMHVKTAGASGQASTVQDSDENLIGAPANSVGGYKFLNPGNSTGTCIFSIWWEELPIK